MAVALRRVLALLLVVGMVGGALALRTAREEQAERARAGGGPTDDAPTLTCAAVLDAVCADLVTALRDDGHDVALASDAPQAGAAPAAGALLTLAPLHELVPGAGQPSPVLARTPLLAAVWDDRGAILEAHCGGTLSWRCIGEAAGSRPGTWAAIGGEGPWGVIKPGHDDPATSEVGVLVLGQLAVGYYGTAAVTANDLDDAGFFAWFVGLQDVVPAQPATGAPLPRMVSAGRGAYDVLAVTEAEAAGLLARTAERAASLRLRPVEPLVTADVVVTGIGQEEDVLDLVESVAERAPALLAAAGWRVEGQQPSAALAQAGLADLTLPTDSGLPSAGTIEALRRTWAEVNR